MEKHLVFEKRTFSSFPLNLRMIARYEGLGPLSNVKAIGPNVRRKERLHPPPATESKMSRNEDKSNTKRINELLLCVCARDSFEV